MANRIKFGWLTGETGLTFSVFDAEGVTTGVTDESLPEIGTTGYFTAIPSVIMVEGDVAVIRDSASREIGFGEYLLDDVADNVKISIATGSRVLNKYPTRSQPDV